MARTTRQSAAKTRQKAPKKAASPPPPSSSSSSPSPAPSSPIRPPDLNSDHGEGDTSSLTQLKFNQPLSWRAGRAIPVAELLKRLEALAQELRQYEQEELDINSLTNVSRELASGHLLAHRDKGVRAWTGCCLVDVLRLCAPDAPFTGTELRDIFTAIITSIIPALADPANAYNEQHIYVLSSLAEVKSIVLLTDLDNADTLILSLFSTCFDIVSGSTKASTGEELAKKVEYDMIRLLVPVIDEASTLTSEVIDVIIAQFLRVDPRALGMNSSTGKNGGKKGTTSLDPKQKTLLPKEYPPAYNMAKAICSACPEKMTSYVSQYFNNVILDASAPSNSLNGTSRKGHNAGVLNDSEDEAEDIKELSKAHRLIRELWRACPDILQNVVPQIEAELSAESVSLRLLATQTVGDMVSGIGVAGPPPLPPMDPAAYPQAKYGGNDDANAASRRGLQSEGNVLLTPLSPKPFSQVHTTTYNSFLSRKQDRSAVVRTAWTTAVGRIILTNAGGVGLSSADEAELIRGLARMLADADENVRIAGVEVLGTFGLDDVVTKIGGDGGVDTPDSILSILAERVKDRKQSVREVAMKVLGRIWGVASGEIEKGTELVVKVLKDIPTRILSAFYANNLEIEVLINRAMFELLLPLTYPPIKSKGKDKERAAEGSEINVDAIRVKRILTLAKHLDDRAKKIFFLFQSRQLSLATFMRFFITACEEYNGGIMKANETETKEKLTRIIAAIAKTLPDSSKASADLWKFAMMHDRRNYHLIRFAMDVNSDYKTVVRAIRELVKRVESSSSPLSSSFDAYLLPLVYRSSSLIFNRSHVPPIMEISRTDESGLGGIAHEMLKEMSTNNPEVLEAHVTDICKDIENAAPDADNEDKGTRQDIEQLLKACAGFAKKLPAKIPQERKFMIALTNYAVYSCSPKAAKHAVSTLIAASDKKEMYAKELVKKSVGGWKYGENGFLTKLATMAQLNLLTPDQADEAGDQIINIATEEILLKNRSGQSEGNTEYKWSEEIDDETAAKMWALKILVNRVRSKESSSDEEGFRKFAAPVFTLLTTLVENNGELSKKEDTPATQKSRLRLFAANLILKLCSSKVLCDRMFEAVDFNNIALMVQDPLFPVRSGFVSQLKKRLTRTSHLGMRWYTIAFLLAFEPDINLKESTLTWLRSRTVFFARQSRIENQTVMETTASRLLSLLAHHPDYPAGSLGEEEKVEELSDFARYILFYLSAVANENNLSLIFHIFQRVKQVRDAVTNKESISERLYTLSDLAQATTRRFADIYSQQHKIGGVGAQTVNILQTYPGKMRLPSSLFANLASHTLAQDIAEKNFLSEDVDDRLDRIVRVFMRPPRHHQQPSGIAQQSVKKRKSETSGNSSAATGGDGKPGSPKRAKKTKQRTLTGRTSSAATPGSGSSRSRSKTSKRRKRADENGWGSDIGDDEDEESSLPTNAKKVQTTERRRSGRRSSGNQVSYVEADSDEDDEMMQEWEKANGQGGESQDENEDEMDVDDEDNRHDDGGGKKSDGDESQKVQNEDSSDGEGDGENQATQAERRDAHDKTPDNADDEETITEGGKQKPLSDASNQVQRRARPVREKEPQTATPPVRRSKRSAAN